MNFGQDQIDEHTIGMIDQFSKYTAVGIEDLPASLVNDLYRMTQLTQDEYIVLDFIGSIDRSLLRDGQVAMSFQGIKRLISIHQARLTKAINRLLSKDLLQKVPAGYALTDEGAELYTKVLEQYKVPRKSRGSLFSHVVKGLVQGPGLSKDQLDAISEVLTGKWFGSFRFTSKVEYDDSFEVRWISTDGKMAGSVLIGPKNEIRMIISSNASSIILQKELQMLVTYLSQTLEEAIDAPVVLNTHSFYHGTEPQHLDNDDIALNLAG